MLTPEERLGQTTLRQLHTRKIGQSKSGTDEGCSLSQLSELLKTLHLDRWYVCVGLTTGSIHRTLHIGWSGRVFVTARINCLEKGWAGGRLPLQREQQTTATVLRRVAQPLALEPFSIDCRV